MGKIVLRWKRAATSRDMTEIIRWCRKERRKLITGCGPWQIGPRGSYEMEGRL